MNFYDKITEMGYEEKERTDNYIMIIKKEDISDVVILFSSKEKTISGYLKPNTIIKELEDITHQYTVFRQMKKDIKELSELSHYDII